MASSSVTEAQIRSEIARLTATINERKSIISGQNSGYPRTNSRNNTYINPNYKPANKYTRPNINIAQSQPPSLPQAQPQVKPPSTKVKDVVINGVAFESSGRSLVRKDREYLWPSCSLKFFWAKHTKSNFAKSSTIHPEVRPSYSKFSNVQAKVGSQPSRASSEPQYDTDQHDPSLPHDPAKIAICWTFLQGNCSYTAETCALSHDPTPERTPLCMHYLNKGRCTRDNCPFPHVNVGTREGICRDFAVLGYCEKGLDCDKQHVRECPDFAEKGTCGTKGCKLPHVIRANRARKPTTKPTDTSAAPTAGNVATGTDSFEEQQAVYPTADNAQLGDEYISLTFKESESEEEDSDEEENDEDENEEDQEGYDPTGLELDPE
ncbi:hypothetical protein C0995_014768 [Termitomyces sp. Mi166|nr:hypothetical protein C0995_014768 [Termitomyces sp. Mi166\